VAKRSTFLAPLAVLLKTRELLTNVRQRTPTAVASTGWTRATVAWPYFESLSMEADVQVRPPSIDCARKMFELPELPVKRV